MSKYDQLFLARLGLNLINIMFQIKDCFVVCRYLIAAELFVLFHEEINQYNKLIFYLFHEGFGSALAKIICEFEEAHSISFNGLGECDFGIEDSF